MADYLGTKLGEWFSKKKIIQEDEIDDIRFGFETLCSEILEFLIIVCYGVYTKTYLETFLYIFLFRILRKLMPGYHAKTIWKCFVLTIGAYLITMYTYQFVDLRMGIILLFIGLSVQIMYTTYTADIKLLLIVVGLYLLGILLVYINYCDYIQLLLMVHLIVSMSWLPERRGVYARINR